MISQLAQSDSVAFRVEYAGKLPPSTQRYFRVLVMDRFDGYAWRASRPRPLTATVHGQGTAIRYTLTLEPHNKPWLPVMDYADPVSLPIGSQLNTDFSVTQKELVQQRKRYSVISYASLGNTLDSAADHVSRDLDLPAAGNPRARATRSPVAQRESRRPGFHQPGAGALSQRALCVYLESTALRLEQRR